MLPRLPRGLCYVDYKNAFDRLMHNELLEVIKRTGIPVLEQDIHVASDVSPWPLRSKSKSLALALWLKSLALVLGSKSLAVTLA